MSKKNLVVAFLLLSGVAITLAYAAGSRSNWLTDNQINFTDKRTSEHGNKLTAIVWDTVMNGLTTWAQNHEKRLQAFAQTPGYPNLTSEQTTFTDLLSTRHNNQLTAEMWNGLVGKLTTAITNHEMRLRKVESNTSMAPVAPKKVDGKCGTRAGQCETGKAISGSVANIWHCEGSNGGTTAYNCQVVAIQYECVGHYDTGRTTERWEGKNASLNCYMRRPSDGSSVRLGSMGCPENKVSGMIESRESGDGRPRFNEFTRGFFDPTATNGYGDITSANRCLHEYHEEDSEFNVHHDVECFYACRYNQSKHGDKCTKIVTPITESCSGFDQNRCSTTPGCTRQKK